MDRSERCVQVLQVLTLWVGAGVRSASETCRHLQRRPAGAALSAAGALELISCLSSPLGWGAGGGGGGGTGGGGAALARPSAEAGCARGGAGLRGPEVLEGRGRCWGRSDPFASLRRGGAWTEVWADRLVGLSEALGAEVQAAQEESERPAIDRPAWRREV